MDKICTYYTFDVLYNICNKNNSDIKKYYDSIFYINRNSTLEINVEGIHLEER